ncbi:MAG: DUF839 domain-containing protein [Alphaproteobacteria bacterium]|nr:DUF839 domain-containing protein [Alphaproteobacteria bacterium]
MSPTSDGRLLLLLGLIAVGCEGPPGADGTSGVDGVDGVDGLDGQNGQNGQNGLDGQNGQNGQNGTDGQNGQDGEDGRHLLTLRFADVAFPRTDDEKRSVLSSSQAWVGGEAVDIGFHTILRGGETVNSTGTFGQIFDIDGAPVQDEDGVDYVSVGTDFSSILQLTDGSLWSVTHFETAPGAMYLTELNQDATTGALTAVSTQNIDMSGVYGLYTPCAGSVTPWNTHLGGEEYPPDARGWEEAEVFSEIDVYTQPQLRYYGFDIYTDADEDGEPDNVTLEDVVDAGFHPYHHGFATEVEVSTGGSVQVTKHYSMGRLSIELSYVMPDEQTVYITDDGTNVGFFMYIADAPGDLSAGTLYAMKWYQTSDIGAGAADLEWISLGHATDAEVEALFADNIEFSDIFDATEPEDGLCPEGYTSVNAAEHDLECLSLRSGMALAASRLETDRYADYLGATLELRKEEGVTYDPDHNRLYLAISEIERGMESYARSGSENPRYDEGRDDDVRLAWNDCGAVYAVDLAPNATIGSEYVAAKIYPLLAGVMIEYPESSDYHGNACSVNNVSNPDNLTYIPGYQVLIVGEDTDNHQNDVLWAYDLRAGTLDRIQTTPYGSETTSPYFYADINGWSYIKSVIQHPYGESDEDRLEDPLDAEAYDGYIGPFPSLAVE